MLQTQTNVSSRRTHMQAMCGFLYDILISIFPTNLFNQANEYVYMYVARHTHTQIDM